MNAVTFNAGAVVTVTPNLNATFNAGRGFRAANAADLGSIGLTGGGRFEVTPSRAATLGGFVGSTVAAGAVSTGSATPPLGPEVLYSFEPGVKFHRSRVSVSVSVYHLEYLDSESLGAPELSLPLGGSGVRQGGASAAPLRADS